VQPITAPLRPGDQGGGVAGLQAGLILLLDRQAIQADDATRRELAAELAREIRSQVFRSATEKAVTMFQESRGLEPSGTVDDRTARVLNAFLRELGAFGGTGSAGTDSGGGADSGGGTDSGGGETATAEGEYRVQGRLSSATRAGVGGVRVVVNDRNVGGDTALIETNTGPQGTYGVAFAYPGPKEKPDLQAKAYVGGVLVGSSAVRYDAAYDEILDIQVAGGAQAALAAEHDTLIADLATHYGGRLGDLQESEERPDVTYLANKTGWDARAVAIAALADQFSARTAGRAGEPEIHPALFYALFRAGVPANDTAIYRADTGSVEAIWRQGIEQGVVAAHLADQLPATLERFRGLSARQALEGPAVAGRSTLTQMLAVSLPGADPAQQEEFARLQFAHAGDPAGFWQAVRDGFGGATADRLQLDGKLGYLTLNNAPLIAALHAEDRQTPLTDPAELIGRGYHQPDRWLPLIDTPPPEIPGEGDEAKANYAAALAAQLRLSYPTATVAALIQDGQTPAGSGVHAFLTEHGSAFDISTQPIEQYAARHQLQLDDTVRAGIARIQRVRQITPSDDAMNVLLNEGIDSAYAVARFDRSEFVAAFGPAVGGPDRAALIHARAQQIHSAVLNIATSYVLASRAPGIGVHSPAQIVNPAPTVPENTGDVIAYPTLEKLLGEMDYCDCLECRSVLSPAAYLVDLLQFLDRDDVRWAQFRTQWKAGHGGAPYPFVDMAAWNAAGQPGDTEITPLAVLLSRRPDLQHLPLTCENTNTPLPYIDLVNETLEYYVAEGLTLEGFEGHTTDDHATPAELLANPQFVQDSAYDIVAGKGLPEPLLPPVPPLPFHLPLERLRRLFAAFEAPLASVMETVRDTEDLERADESAYAWRDIWMEQLKLSRAEYARLTNRTLTLQQLYGFPPATSDGDTLSALSNAKAFCLRLELSFEDLVTVLRTRFVNPNGALIPKLERLGVPVATLKALKDATISDDDFDAALAPKLDPAQYGGDIKDWVRDDANYDKIMSLLVLADPTASDKPGTFDLLEFRYADPAELANEVRPFEFVRLLRFIRLWRALGWSIEQTDKALTALYPADQIPDDDSDSVNLERLDTGFLTALPRLGVVSRVMDRLNLKPRKDLLPLLACFAPLDTYGPASLYRTLFVSPPPLDAAAFAEDGYGGVLGGSENLLDHTETLRAALNLTADELTTIAAALGYDGTTKLTVDTVSAILRRGWLARKLKLSVKELLRLCAYSGIDPFAEIDPVAPPMLALLDLVTSLRTAGLKPGPALYLMWNDDLKGASAPASGQVDEFVRNLRTGFAGVEAEFGVVDDPDGQIARARMALVYDAATTDLFFGLLNDTLVTDVAYSHPQPVLEQAILDAAPGRVGYDDYRKRLSYTGVMTTAARDALKTADPAVPFQTAVDALYAANQQIVAPFFAKYAELQPLYDAYVASTDPPEQKRSALLANFLPALRLRRKRQQALAAIGAVAKTDPALPSAILDNAAVLHAAADITRPVLDDLVGVERAGLAAAFFFADTATGTPDETSEAESTLDYHDGGAEPHPLPANGGDPVSGVWTGHVEGPATGFYNIRVETDAGATVTLEIGGKPIALTQDGTRWSNAVPIELRAGALHALTLTVEKVSDVLSVRWQTMGRGWEVVPGRYLYSSTLRDRVRWAYTRFLKTASLVTALKLTPGEAAYLAAHADSAIGGQGWLNALPVDGAPDQPTAAGLTAALRALLDFARFKAVLAPDTERLLEVLVDPVAAAKPDGTLGALAGWEQDSLTALLDRFGVTSADLEHLAVFRRVYAAFELTTTLGIPAAALITAATNEPAAQIVRDVQSALRSRYAASDWLDVVKPVNDDLRGRQRDALVAYVLHQMRSNASSAHIDTPEKLFEYFLMDVQMEPCTQTSRIRNALSSIQLFIERCLMNLEPRVAASALTPAHWEWMKRYRVWEANRKVFLWPENWLEPELRDDQSPFFKEMMSELLQSDITDDAAAAALGRYLVKLDLVAKLEPCGIHFVESNPGVADDVAYVVARTTGAGSNYYSRRCEYGYWTPWEPIKLDIEDTPVIPVVWKSRLFLFWLRLIQQPLLPKPAPFTFGTADKDLTQIKAKEVKTDPPWLNVQAMLCWSECVKGVWQAAKTSDSAKPTALGTFAPGDFDRSQLRMWAREQDGALHIGIDGNGGSNFLLYNTHSLPVREEDLPPFSFGFDTGPQRYLSVSGTKLTASYAKKPIVDVGFPDPSMLHRPILENLIDDGVVEPANELIDRWGAPFFYGDGRHVFYVTTEQEWVNVNNWLGYTAVIPLASGSVENLPPLVFQKPSLIPDRAGPVINGHNTGLVDPAPMERFVTEDAYISKGLGTLGTVSFGGLQIGPSGALSQQQLG